MSKQTKSTKQSNITRDYSLMSNMRNHIRVYGFASVVDNIVATCEDGLVQWNERLVKAKKLRKVLGGNYGRN